MRAARILVIAYAAVACRTGSADPPGPRQTVADRTGPTPTSPPDAGASAELPPPPPEPEPEPEPPPPPPPPTFVEHLSPGGIAETCQLLPRFPFDPPDLADDPETMRYYRDDDFEDVATLCAMDFYLAEDVDGLTAHGVCTKLHFSTPALEIYDLAAAEMDKATFEKKRCPRYRDRQAPKLAKLKVPVYSKESESAILYFHFSRLLGNDGLVYPATTRTIDRTELVRWSKSAVKRLNGRGPAGGWSRLRIVHSRKDAAELVFGSLAKNPRGEHSHYLLNFLSLSQFVDDPGYYRKKSLFRLVASGEPIGELLDLDPSRPPRKYHKAVQRLAHGLDFVHLLILDSLFNARDRKGNIHAKNFHHHVDDAGHLRWTKDRDKVAPAADGTPRVTVELERLILKDNDDGLLWSKFGKMSSGPVVKEVRHLDALTYARIQWLADLMRDPATSDQVEAFFVDAVKVRAAVYQGVEQRFLAMAARFEKAFDKGKLRLDLDLEAAVAAAPELPADERKKKSKKKSKKRKKKQEPAE